MQKVQEKDFNPVQFWYRIARLCGTQWLARAFALVGINFVAAFTLSFVSPAAGEAWMYTAVWYTAILTAGFLGLVTLAGIGVSATLAGILVSLGIREVRREVDGDNRPKLIGESGCDLLITEHENPGDGKRLRMQIEYAIANSRIRDIIAIAPFKADTAHIIFAGQEKTVSRSQLAASQTDFAAETIDEYFDWCELAKMSFPITCRALRGTMEPLPLNSLPVVKKFLTTLVCLLFAFAMFGQNAAAIAAAIGEANSAPGEGVSIRYTFSSGQSFTRTADGTQTVAQLFASRTGADGAKLGDVTGVKVGPYNLEIKQSQKAEAAGTMQEPKPLFTKTNAPESALPLPKAQLPDSNQVAEGVNTAMDYGEKIKSQLSVSIRPIIGLLIYILGWIVWPVLIFGAMAWYVAGTSRDNGNLGRSVLLLQRWSSAQVLYACYAFFIPFLLYCFLSLSYAGFPLWLSVVAVGIGVIIARRITNAITPNGKSVPFEEISRYDSGANRGLNSGR